MYIYIVYTALERIFIEWLGIGSHCVNAETEYHESPINRDIYCCDNIFISSQVIKIKIWHSHTEHTRTHK